MRDEKADGGNWMIDRKNDVIFYESVLASGRFCKFSKLDCICADQFFSISFLNV